MAEGRKVQVTAAIICDEVRIENNHKFFLIGVYSGQILVPSFPAGQNLSAYFEISGLAAGQHPINVRLSAPAGETLVVDGLLVADGDTPAAVYTPSAPIPLQHEGEIVVNLAVAGEEFPGIIRKRVSIGQPIPSV